jgi:hypothetical protein
LARVILICCLFVLFVGCSGAPVQNIDLRARIGAENDHRCSVGRFKWHVVYESAHELFEYSGQDERETSNHDGRVCHLCGVAPGLFRRKSLQDEAGETVLSMFAEPGKKPRHAKPAVIFLLQR